MAFKIQLIGIESVTQLSDIAIRAYRDHYLHIWKNDNADWYINRCFTIEALTIELNDPKNAFYLIYDDGELLGFLKLVHDAPLVLPSHSDIIDSTLVSKCLYLERIYFVKKAVGKGLGEKVFQFTQELAQKMGYTLIWLSAMDTSIKPIQFYERMGFVIESTKKLNFEHIKDDMRGMVVMKKSL